MIDTYIERMIAQGKVTPEEIDAQVSKMLEERPPSEVDALKEQLADVWEMILFGGEGV